MANLSLQEQLALMIVNSKSTPSEALSALTIVLGTCLHITGVPRNHIHTALNLMKEQIEAVYDTMEKRNV